MLINLPLLKTDISDIDYAFRLACGDLTGNIAFFTPASGLKSMPVITAGGDYHSPWVRDASFNNWFAGFIAPQCGISTLLSELSEDEKWGLVPHDKAQYWDNIIWVWGAWHAYCNSGDDDFLAIAWQVSENILRQKEEEEYDPADGLFYGGACFQDGIAAYPDAFLSASAESGIMHHIKNPAANGAKPRTTGGGADLKALSTNCLYLAAYQYCDAMRARLGMDRIYDGKAETLRNNINKYFYLPEKGTYRYLFTPWENMPERQEGLGHAFALLTGVVPEELQEKLVAGVHRTPYGIPCVWPQYERYASEKGVYARHSGVIWPQVMAAWCCALAANGFRREAWQETRSLASLAVPNHMFHEIYHPETGKPYGGIQEDNENGMREWLSCRRQTWCATGYIRMVLASLFGLQTFPGEIILDPALPEGCEEIFLQGFEYGGMTLNIKVSAGENDSVTTVKIIPGETADIHLTTTRRI